jgi:signal transduction histidine kinase
MKPLLAEITDESKLQDLGRASVQVIHDLKNQLNGLKLYATFLRKRMEKEDRPLEERETVSKLISGLERAASDMTSLVRYGRPIEIRARPGTDLVKMIATTAGSEAFESRISLSADVDCLPGNFDQALLAEALSAISAGALNMPRGSQAGAVSIHLQLKQQGAESQAFIEWRGVISNDGEDPFKSFAGSQALRMSLAAKIIEAHGGRVGHGQGGLYAILPVGRPNDQKAMDVRR